MKAICTENEADPLSAVDDQLRHEADQPSIGIIICQRRNEVIVEYAARDTAKPMGVAEYRLAAALPPGLRNELPTVEDLARDFPLMFLVKLRAEIEREFAAHSGGARAGQPQDRGLLQHSGIWSSRAYCQRAPGASKRLCPP